MISAWNRERWSSWARTTEAPSSSATRVRRTFTDGTPRAILSIQGVSRRCTRAQSATSSLTSLPITRGGGWGCSSRISLITCRARSDAAPLKFWTLCDARISVLELNKLIKVKWKGFFFLESKEQLQFARIFWNLCFIRRIKLANSRTNFSRTDDSENLFI